MTGRMFTIKTVLTDYFQGTIGETKLRELIRRGEIPHSRVVTKIVFREETLDKWFSQKEGRHT